MLRERSMPLKQAFTWNFGLSEELGIKDYRAGRKLFASYNESNGGKQIACMWRATIKVAAINTCFKGTREILEIIDERPAQYRLGSKLICIKSRGISALVYLLVDSREELDQRVKVTNCGTASNNSVFC